MKSLWLIFFFNDEFFRLKSVICKKNTSTNGKDSKHTNTIDTSIIWLYWMLYWRLYWRLYCRLFFVMQCFFFSFFITEASLWPSATRPGCFSRVISFSSSSVIFYLTQNQRRNSFRIYKHACFDFFKKFLATTNSSSVCTSFSSCIILRSPLSFGYHTKMVFVCLLKFFGIAQ